MVGKPSDKEEEYFARIEYERKRKIEEERRQRFVEAEKKELKALHHQRCPKCGLELVEIDYKEIRIDKCSGCGGIWLDSGEFEAISKIEKSAFNKLFDVFKNN